MVSESASAIELSWTHAAGAARYEPRAYTDEEGWIYFDYTARGVTTFTHRGLVTGRDYYYWVRGVSETGKTLEWSVRLDTTASDAQPTAPSTATPAATATPTITPTPTVTLTSTVTPTPATTERGALIALYQATDGDNWVDNENWLSDKPLDTWDGVYHRRKRTRDCTPRSQQYERVDPDLSALTDLRYLVLPGNRARADPGSEPPHRTWRSGPQCNELSGPIPDLSPLTDLRGLELSVQPVERADPGPERPHRVEISRPRGKPAERVDSGPEHLANLEYLNFRGNRRLSGEIPDLSALTKLKRLYL